MIMEKEKFKSRVSDWIKDNHNKIFLAIFVFAFILRLIIFFKTTNQPLWWDEADYMSAAKRWGLSLDIRDMWYYRRGFFWPLFGAIFFKLRLGEIAIRFSEVLFSVGIVAVSYFLISKMFNKNLALLVSFGISLSWIALFFTGRVMTDIPGTFFVLLALLLFWKGYMLNENKKFIWISGIFFGLALLTRFQYVMFLPSFFILVLLKEKLSFYKNKNLWILLACLLIIILPFFILYWMHFGNVVTDILARYFGIGASAAKETSALKIGNIPKYLYDFPYMLTTSIFVLFILGSILFLFNLILGLDKIFENEELKKKIFILSWMLIPMAVLGYITVYVEQRYIMPLLPFLFLIAVLPLQLLANFLRENMKFEKKLCYFIILVIFAILLIQNYNFSNSLLNSKLTSYSEARSAGIYIKQHTNSSDIIISPSVPQITYYSERSTYGFPANDSEFDTFLKTNKPSYVFISAFEKYPDYVEPYFKQHPIAILEKTYYQGQQSVAFIYKLDYSYL